MFNYFGNTTGCYNCTNRKVGCHSNCKIYEDYKQRQDVINKRKKEIKILEMKEYLNRGRRKSKTA